MLKKDYFARAPRTNRKIDYEYFTNYYFMPYYRRHRKAITGVHENAIMFCQPPVLEIPPSIKGTDDDDPNMVFSPHYYDGVTLMMKKWYGSKSKLIEYLLCMGLRARRNRYWKC